MADRRMFSKSIADNDQFLDMPLSAQALYFHLCLRADDDGFVGNPKSIQRSISASTQDMTELIEKRYILPFETGVIVIRHWKLHNTIQKDRYHPTIYTGEFQQLQTAPNKEYIHVSEMDTVCFHPVSEMETELGKIRLGELDKERVGPAPLSLEQIRQWMETYASERNVTFNIEQQAQKFFNYYAMHGWKNSTGGDIQDWAAAVTLWLDREKDPDQKPQPCKLWKVKEFR